MWLHVPSIPFRSTLVSEELNSDSPQLSKLARSVTLRGNFPASKSLFKELKKAGLTALLSTVTLPHSRQKSSKISTSLPQGFHASRGVGQTHHKPEGKTTSETVGPIPSGSFARFDPYSYLWRTSQISLITGTLAPYSETWPRQGTMRNGTVFRGTTSTHRKSGNGFSYWPTPTRRDWKDGPAANYDYPVNAYLGREVPAWTVRHSSLLPPITWKDGHMCGKKCLTLRPAFVSWLQGFPIGWASYNHMGMQSFRQWQHSLSELLWKSYR